MRIAIVKSLPIRTIVTRAVLLIFLLAAGVLPFFSWGHSKYETIEATAMAPARSSAPMAELAWRSMTTRPLRIVRSSCKLLRRDKTKD